MKKVFAFTGISALLLLAGCQSVSDQINQKVGEKIAEQMIENASGGKVQVDAGSNSMKIKTEDGDVEMTGDGNNMVIKSSEGEAVFGGGDDRPASVGADLPNLPGAKSYAWMGSAEGGMFSFNVEGADYKAACSSEIDLLVSAGWTLDSSVSMEFNNSMTKAMTNSAYTLNVSCSTADDGMTSVILIKSQKTN